MVAPKKTLGQHWLNDRRALEAVVKAAEIEPEDFILEIGPGLGALTQQLVKAAGQVLAVEIDRDLAAGLNKRLMAGNLEIVNQDIRRFDFTTMPANYKVVGNIPYFLTGHLLRLLVETPNQPRSITMLLQKEVAQRLVAEPGKLSLIAVTVQLYYEPQLGREVKAELFEPPPKVDSQIITLRRRPFPLFKNLDSKKFFYLVRAGFSSPRKKLRGSLSGGLRVSSRKADEMLLEADLNGDLRPGALSMKQWHDLYTVFMVQKDLHSLLH
jgi:16S rRNA (adenine1518-N6/adenine1519-N6)-dimethyltransferase